MKETLQTKFGKRGNCFQACLATVFSLSIDDIPEFDSDDFDWCFKLSGWLKTKGKFLMAVELKDKHHIELLNNSICIASIESSHPEVERHAVITKGDKIIFDPTSGVVDIDINFDETPVFYIIGDILEW